MCIVFCMGKPMVWGTPYFKKLFDIFDESAQCPGDLRKRRLLGSLDTFPPHLRLKTELNQVQQV